MIRADRAADLALVAEPPGDPHPMAKPVTERLPEPPVAVQWKRSPATLVLGPGTYGPQHPYLKEPSDV